MGSKSSTLPTTEKYSNDSWGVFASQQGNAPPHHRSGNVTILRKPVIGFGMTRHRSGRVGLSGGGLTGCGFLQAVQKIRPALRM
jgi:hypothetical protein